MSSAWWRQHEKRKTVVIGYRNEAGVRVQHATKCRTITEGKEMARKLEERADRVRRGLEAPHVEDITFAEAARKRLDNLAPEFGSREALESRLRKHVLPRLGTKPMRSITPADVESLLNKTDASIQTREHIRIAIQGVFTFCVEKLNRRELANPAKVIGKLEVPDRDPAFLSQTDLLRLFEKMQARWRIPFLVAVGTAIRRGELLPLLKSDVRIVDRKILVTKSNRRAMTKTKRERAVPIPEWLVPYLEHQIATAPGPLLFPNDEGKQWGRWVKLNVRIADGLRRARLVKHYELRCRRKGCAFTPEISATPDVRPCPVCTFKLYPRRIPIDFRWKDLRSTWATHAAAMTGDIRFVQVVLGHGSVVTTTKRYAHALPSHIQTQAGRVDLGFGSATLAQLTSSGSAREQTVQGDSPTTQTKENTTDAD